MLLVVGLGNPGKEYANNRHNIGFMAIDHVVRRYSFSTFRSKFQGEIAHGTIGITRVLALKPKTFMNESGRCVKAVMDFYKIPSKNVIVIHDEIDLVGGKVRVKIGGGHAGHNGLRSIDAHVGPEFVRVRIGVGHPGTKDKVASHVLKDFAKSERNWVEKTVDAVGEFIPFLVVGDHVTFMSKVASIFSPSRLNSTRPEVSNGNGKQIEKNGD